MRQTEDVTLVSIPAAAARLDCSRMHVYRLIGAGMLRPVDIAVPGSGRPRTRIRSDDLDEYIKSHTRATGTGGEGA